eukprot:scaffold61790_cov49-Attheya_sp.AAC.2
MPRHSSREGAARSRHSLSKDVVDALASARCLRQLELEIPSSAPLASLCESPTLEMLTVESYGSALENDHLLPMAEALCNNQVLRELDLDYRISPMGIFTIAAMLEQNSNVLGKLHNIAFGSPARCATKDVGTKYDAKIVCILSRIRRRKYQKEEGHDLNTKLNAGGRKDLFDQEEIASKGGWVDVMTKTRDKLDCLFYCLSTNPSLRKLDDHYSSVVGDITQKQTIWHMVMTR